jgi:hypothetical protein
MAEREPTAWLVRHRNMCKRFLPLGHSSSLLGQISFFKILWATTNASLATAQECLIRLATTTTLSS